MSLAVLLIEQPPSHDAGMFTQVLSGVSQRVDRQGRHPGGEIRVNRPTTVRTYRALKELNGPSNHGVAGAPSARHAHRDEADQWSGFQKAAVSGLYGFELLQRPRNGRLTESAPQRN